MKQLFFFFTLIFLIGFSSCKKDTPAPDREKFIGTYSGTQTITTYIDNQLNGTTTEAGTESITAGTFDNQVIIGKGSNNEMTATVQSFVLSMNTQPVFVKMDNGTTLNFSTSGTGLLSGKNLTLDFEMKSNSSGTYYRYVVKETLVKN